MGEWIGSAEAAQLLGIKQATLYAYVSRGVLRRRRGPDGRSSLFDPAEIASMTDRARPRRAGGTAGFVIESAVTEISDGRPRYRGMEVTQLALWRPFEEVAEWLWTGTYAKDGPPPPWQATSDAIRAGTAAQTGLPAGTLPLERLQVIVPAMAATDPFRLHLDPPAVMAAGRSMIAGMVECLPDPGSGSAPPGPQGGIAGRLWYKICSRRPDPGLLGALRDALALLAGHELAASTFAARVAASVRADPYAVVTTGLGALGGALHEGVFHESMTLRNAAYGGGSLGAETLLATAREPSGAARVVGDQLRRGERLPGFGLSAYHSGDPRAALLLDLIRKAAPRSARHAVAASVLEEVRRRALPEPNIDFALAVLGSVAGMIPGAGEAILAVARTSGWIAHAMEEYARDIPLRPRAVYTGPPAPVG
jgi:citrate synthase